MIGSTCNWDVIAGVSLPPHWRLLRTRAALLLSVSTPNAAQSLAHSQGSVNTGRMSERVKECSKFEVLPKALRFQSRLCLSPYLGLGDPKLSDFTCLCFTLEVFIAILFAASSLAAHHFFPLSSLACRQNWDGRHLSHMYLTLSTRLVWVMPETVMSAFFSSP